jgi:PAS domain S-box-containing protein
MKNLQMKSRIIENFLKLCSCSSFYQENEKFIILKLLALLDTIFKLSPELLTLIDEKSKYIMCSNKFFELFGIPFEDEILGMSYSDFYLKEQQKEIKTFLDFVKKEKRAKVCIQKNKILGNDFLLEKVSSPLFLEDKIFGILTYSKNLTDVVYLQKSLETSNKILYALINNTPYIAYVMDKKGNLISGNAQAKKMFETGVDELDFGQEVHLDTSSQVFLDTMIRENLELLKSGKGLNIERQLVSTTGEKYWYKIIKSPIKDADDEYCSVVTFIKNIDTEKLAQEQRETYIATLSHDLKTPAIAQVRALELLLSGQFGDFNKEQKEMLEMTLESCNYLYEMVYTLLSTCKLENGSFSLNYSTFDIIPIVSECIYEMSNLTNENSINIEFEHNVEICIVEADRIEIKRVIINLLSNAIKYAFPSSNIIISLNVMEDNVELLVKNSSPYIEPIALKRLFGKYVTNSDKFNKVGFGLGLYLSKRIIEKHNGCIIAESLKSQNNIFGFSIPVKIEKPMVGVPC